MALETHAAIGWLDDGGRLCLRATTQTPFLTRRALCALFDLPPGQVHIEAGRMGGGFGGKQEMLVEDIVALAVLRCRAPVQLELTREEQFSASTTRHPMRIKVTLGATCDGVLTAIGMEVLSNTGAYGNHGRGVLFHACGESVAVYRCPNKRVDGYAVRHQYRAGRGVSRLRAASDHVRDRIGDGRIGAPSRTRPDRACGGATWCNPAMRWSRSGARPMTWSSAATGSTSV